jgi:hypothetical protein
LNFVPKLSVGLSFSFSIPIKKKHFGETKRSRNLEEDTVGGK